MQKYQSQRPTAVHQPTFLKEAFMSCKGHAREQHMEEQQLPPVLKKLDYYISPAVGRRPAATSL